MAKNAASHQEAIEHFELTSEPFFQWLATEDASRDSIAVKRIYIDINDGYIQDAVLFSQILYWHGKTAETGETRLRVVKEGCLWLAKTYEDWWEECRLPASTAKACLDRLKNRGLVICKRFKFNGSPTVHIRVVWNALVSAIRLIQSNPLDRFSPMEKTDSSQTLTEITPEITDKDYSKNIKRYDFPPMSEKSTPLLGGEEVCLKADNSQQATSNGYDAQTTEEGLQRERQVDVACGKSMTSLLGTATTAEPIYPTGVKNRDSASQQPAKQNSQSQAASTQTSNTRSNVNLTPPPTPSPSRANSLQSSNAVHHVEEPNLDKTLHRTWIDEDGWLQLPRADRYKLQRYFATRRMQLLLQALHNKNDSLCKVELAIDEDGNTIQEEGETLFLDEADDEQWESDMFHQSSTHSLRPLRNFAYADGLITQEKFNEDFAILWDDAISYCEMQGQYALESIRDESIIQAFHYGDCENLEYPCSWKDEEEVGKGFRFDLSKISIEDF